MSDLKAAWADSVGIREKESGQRELFALRAELSEPASLEPDEVSRFLELLARLEDDPDVLHETVMQIDPQVFGVMFGQDANSTRRIIERFVELTTSQGWGFDYTDKIGDRCLAIFEQISDFEGRAALAYCAAEVGTSHNRWHVMSTAAKMLLALTDQGGAMAVGERLRKLDSRALETLREYCGIGRCHPAIDNVLR